MVSRYDSRNIGVNRTEQYENLLKDRGIRQIRQHFTPTLRHPTAEEIATLEIVGHDWQVGSHMWKLAEKHYGDPEKWWVIAQFNQKPTDAHISIGEVIDVPLPLDQILRLLDA